MYRVGLYTAARTVKAPPLLTMLPPSQANAFISMVIVYGRVTLALYTKGHAAAVPPHTTVVTSLAVRRLTSALCTPAEGNSHPAAHGTLRQALREA